MEGRGPGNSGEGGAGMKTDDRGSTRESPINVCGDQPIMSMLEMCVWGFRACAHSQG